MVFYSHGGGGGSSSLFWTFQVIQGSFEKPKQSRWIIQPWKGVGMKESEDKIYQGSAELERIPSQILPKHHAPPPGPNSEVTSSIASSTHFSSWPGRVCFPQHKPETHHWKPQALRLDPNLHCSLRQTHLWWTTTLLPRPLLRSQA